MSTKVIPATIVTCCNECPFYDEAEFDSSQAWCAHNAHCQDQGFVRDFTEEELDTEDNIPIPAWCPLEDAEIQETV